MADQAMRCNCNIGLRSVRVRTHTASSRPPVTRLFVVSCQRTNELVEST